jgi:hypothetical protein
MVDVGGGVFGMIAGDANVSGVVTVADIILMIPGLNGVGYSVLDINMSGVVTVADIVKMIPNLNLSTKVPN